MNINDYWELPRYCKVLPEKLRDNELYQEAEELYCFLRSLYEDKDFKCEKKVSYNIYTLTINWVEVSFYWDAFTDGNIVYGFDFELEKININNWITRINWDKIDDENVVIEKLKFIKNQIEIAKTRLCLIDFKSELLS